MPFWLKGNPANGKAVLFLESYQIRLSVCLCQEGGYLEHGKTALSAHEASRRTKCSYLQHPDQRPAVELFRHHHGKAGCGIGTHALRVYWTVLWLQLVVCSQTTKSKRTECSTLRLVKFEGQ